MNTLGLKGKLFCYASNTLCQPHIDAAASVAVRRKEVSLFENAFQTHAEDMIRSKKGAVPHLEIGRKKANFVAVKRDVSVLKNR